MVRNVGHYFFAGQTQNQPNAYKWQLPGSEQHGQFPVLGSPETLFFRGKDGSSLVPSTRLSKKNTQPPISKCNWVTAKAAKVYVSDRLKNHLRCASVRCALKDPSAVPSASPVHYADSTRQVEFFLQLGVFRNGIRATSFIHSAMI
jgi:hypothetical protein